MRGGAREVETLERLDKRKWKNGDTSPISIGNNSFPQGGIHP